MLTPSYSLILEKDNGGSESRRKEIRVNNTGQFQFLLWDLVRYLLFPGFSCHDFDTYWLYEWLDNGGLLFVVLIWIKILSGRIVLLLAPRKFLKATFLSWDVQRIYMWLVTIPWSLTAPTSSGVPSNGLLHHAVKFIYSNFINLISLINILYPLKLLIFIAQLLGDMREMEKDYALILPFTGLKILTHYDKTQHFMTRFSDFQQESGLILRN